MKSIKTVQTKGHHMLNLADLNNEEARLFEEFYNQLAKRFTVSVEKDLDLTLQHFEMFRLCSNLAYEQVVKICENNGKGYMLIIQVEIPYGYRSKYIPLTHLEFQPWGIGSLPRQFGYIFIKR